MRGRVKGRAWGIERGCRGGSSWKGFYLCKITLENTTYFTHRGLIHDEDLSS